MSNCLITQLEFPPVNQLPTKSLVCVLGAVLAILDPAELASQPDTGESVSRPDTDELVSQPDTDESVSRPDTSDSALVMRLGQHLLNIVDKYVYSLFRLSLL